MKVSVIGLGYVGSVAAAGLSSAGHEVLGIDISTEKIESYRKGVVPFFEPGLTDMISQGIAQGLLRFSMLEDVSEPLGDVILIAAGTPTGRNGEADLSHVKSALEWVKKQQDGYGVVVMKSTVTPGTGLRMCDTVLAGTGLDYVSNPEFLREGQAIEDWFHPDRIVIGSGSQEAIEKITSLYRNIDAPYVVTDITSAEMIKYAANAFLATKISFINEIAALCDLIGASIDSVGDGIALDPRIGGSFLRAGVGYGGSCFPKDVRALDHLALTNDHNFELLRSVITVNNRQRFLPLYALREKFGRLAGVKVCVLGLSFKPFTDDVREAPSLELIDALVDEGVEVVAYDPQVGANSTKHLRSVVRFADNPVECAFGVQAIVLMTEWPEIVDANWGQIAQIVKEPRFLFDGRNALDPLEMRSLGFDYLGVGRRWAHASGINAAPVLGRVGD